MKKLVKKRRRNRAWSGALGAPSYGGARLDKAKEWVLGTGTVSGGVHCSVHDGASSGDARCHRRVFPESRKRKRGAPPLLSREGVFRGLA